MKSILVRVLTVSAALGICATANADTRINEVWICTVNEGKTLEDVQANNSKWVKFMNANVEGGDITSQVVTPIVGNLTTGRFIFVDSFPSLESWSAAKSATEGNEEGEAIDAAFDDLVSCTENHLYEAEQS